MLGYAKVMSADTNPARARRGRFFLAVLGIFFGMFAVVFWWVPSMQARDYASAVCGILGVVLLLSAWLAPARFINHLQGLLTGWP
jgi:heme/copper-type cytochrome/quinol oxidase subunit 1